ncbi:protein lethal(2)essential for life [Microplitis demolitor]|uniref:protein lethal(2)essential for life n=1 Tax=Microplitis demolitor TaxID=69319 RepID=UPI0004CD3314|nr:protein lethal(2)essential for life [Microplitis demolitor]
MSLLPSLFSHWWEDLERPHRLLDQHFGTVLSPQDLLPFREEEPSLLVIRPPKRHHHYHHPYEKSIARRSGTGSSVLQADKNKFQVNLDVQQFAPDEISVKVSGRNVIVEGKHEEKQDEHGWISRQFSRKYLVPEQCDLDQLQSNLSSDGVLSIIAPRKKALEDKNERVIPITQTGQPAITSTDTKSAEPSGSKDTSPQKTPVTRAQDKASKTVKAA